MVTQLRRRHKSRGAAKRQVADAGQLSAQRSDAATQQRQTQQLAHTDLRAAAATHGRGRALEQRSAHLLARNGATCSRISVRRECLSLTVNVHCCHCTHRLSSIHTSQHTSTAVIPHRPPPSHIANASTTPRGNTLTRPYLDSDRLSPHAELQHLTSIRSDAALAAVSEDADSDVRCPLPLR